MDPELKSYLDAKFLELRAGITGEVRAEIEKTETKLLTAFHGWARSMEIRVRNSSTAVAGFDERLALAEERISALERKQ